MVMGDFWVERGLLETIGRLEARLVSVACERDCLITDLSEADRKIDYWEGKHDKTRETIERLEAQVRSFKRQLAGCEADKADQVRRKSVAIQYRDDQIQRLLD